MQRRPKILFYGSFNGGGTERITFNLASALAESGQYDVYVLNTQPLDATFAISEKVKYSTLQPARRFPHPLVNRILDVRRFITKQHIDVAISIEALTGITLLPALIGTGVKPICWEHANYFQTQNSRWAKLIRKIWLRRAAAYVVLTRRDRRNFETHEKARCPIVHIYNPVTIKETSDYNPDSRRIISVGHLAPIKQFHLIPRIFAPIAEQYPDWTWHIYGEGPERPLIEAEIAKYGLQNRVILEGRANNIDPHYAESAIYALTSQMEGLPTVLIEAQMHHLPCVAFDIETGPDEIITHGINGYLVAPYNVNEMTNRLSELIDNTEKRCMFSSQADKDRSNYEPSDALMKWNHLFTSIL